MSSQHVEKKHFEIVYKQDKIVPIKNGISDYKVSTWVHREIGFKIFVYSGKRVIIVRKFEIMNVKIVRLFETLNWTYLMCYIWISNSLPSMAHIFTLFFDILTFLYC